MPAQKILVVVNMWEVLMNYRPQLLRDMQAKGYEVHLACPDDSQRLQQFLQDTGIQLHLYPLSRSGLNPLRDRVTITALKNIMLQLKPDKVMSFTIKPVIYASLAAKAAKVPSINAMITGLGFVFIGDSFKKKIIRFGACQLYKRALKSCDSVFFQNPDDRQLFLQRSLVKQNQTVLVRGSGVDLDYFQPFSLPAEPVFLMVARLLGDKGVREYAAAAAEVKKAHPQARFLLVGWRDDNPACVSQEELDSWSKDGGAIEFLGRLEDVRPAMKQARFFVLPSYREGTPKTVLEAMACGRAVITSDAPGCREAVEHEQSGLLVKPRDADSLANAMCRFIEDPAFAEQLAAFAQVRVYELYDVRKVNASILAGLKIT